MSRGGESMFLSLFELLLVFESPTTLLVCLLLLLFCKLSMLLSGKDSELSLPLAVSMLLVEVALAWSDWVSGTDVGTRFELILFPVSLLPLALLVFVDDWLSEFVHRLMQILFFEIIGIFS